MGTHNRHTWTLTMTVPKEAKTAKTVLSIARAGNVTLANGLVVAPLTRGRATLPGLEPNPLMAEHYAQRSKGGFGLIITEGVQLSPTAIGWWGCPGIWNDAQEKEWAKVVRDTKAAGPSKMSLQLWHLGRQGHSSLNEGVTPVSASAIRLEQGTCHGADGAHVPYETPRALETDEIPGIIDLYVQGAKRAINAGFDFVEIHGANGYLVDQFLQSHTNVRTDKYGGSVENRLRFLQEVVEAVGAAVGEDKVGLRLSPNGVFGGMGCDDAEETFDAAIAYAASRNLAYLHVMDGLAFGFHEKGEPFTMSKVRNHFKKRNNTFTALMGNCGHTLETANTLIENGDADLISFGRPTLNNPDLPRKFQSGQALNVDIPPSLWNRQTTEDQSVGYTKIYVAQE